MPSVSLKSSLFSSSLSTRNCYISVILSVEICLCFPPMDQSTLMRSRREKVCCTASAPPPGSILLHPSHCLYPCLCQPQASCSLTPEVFIINMRWHRTKLTHHNNLLTRWHDVRRNMWWYLFCSGRMIFFNKSYQSAHQIVYTQIFK